MLQQREGVGGGGEGGGEGVREDVRRCVLCPVEGDASVDVSIELYCGS